MSSRVRSHADIESVRPNHDRPGVIGIMAPGLGPGLRPVRRISLLDQGSRLLILSPKPTTVGGEDIGQSAHCQPTSLGPDLGRAEMRKNHHLGIVLEEVLNGDQRRQFRRRGCGDREHHLQVMTSDEAVQIRRVGVVPAHNDRASSPILGGHDRLSLPTEHSRIAATSAIPEGCVPVTRGCVTQVRKASLRRDGEGNTMVPLRTTDTLRRNISAKSMVSSGMSGVIRNVHRPERGCEITGPESRPRPSSERCAAAPNSAGIVTAPR